MLYAHIAFIFDSLFIIIIICHKLSLQRIHS